MRGKSGRLVLEIDPATKRQLYSKLAAEGLTLKDWFLARVERYLANDSSVQLRLAPIAAPHADKEDG